MASSEGYLGFIKDQLSHLGDVAYKKMMGEYIVYYRGRIIGGIYDDRLLVKPTESAKKLMPCAKYQLPYEGGKPMLEVTDVDSREFLEDLFNRMADELPEPAPRSSSPKKRK